jgi:hypothetical protein
VLLIDNELHDATIDNRVPKVADALRLMLHDYGEQLDVLTFRGKLKDIHALAADFGRIQPGQYKVIIIDSLYRTLPPGTDENDNAAMAQIFNLLDAHAMRMKCAFVLIHHSSKGNQSERSVIDVGSGAGSMGRATDSHFILREHEQEGVFVADAAVRSFEKISPFCLKWLFPLWLPVPDDAGLDPADLKPPTQRRRKRSQPKTDSEPRPEPRTAKWFSDQFISDVPAPRAAIIDDAVAAGLSNKQAERLFDRALAKGYAHPRKCPNDKRKIVYADIIQPEESDHTLSP